MKRGEKREIYIHPEYGYGEESYFPPNITLIAKIELVDFEETDHEAAISPPQKLNEKSHKELLSKLGEINKIRYFENGVDFWDHYQKVIDYQSFKKQLLEAPRNESSFEKLNEFLIDLNWMQFPCP